MFVCTYILIHNFKIISYLYTVYCAQDEHCERPALQVVLHVMLCSGRQTRKCEQSAIRFSHDAKKNGIKNYYKDRSILYNYYDLEMPPQEWINYCIEKKVIF